MKRQEQVFADVILSKKKKNQELQLSLLYKNYSYIYNI